MEGLPKQRNIPEKEELGPKRFEIQSDEFVKERFGAIKEGLDLIKNDEPSVLGLTMYGSMVKGTAHEDSDIDGYLFIDAGILETEEAKEALEEDREPRPVTFTIGETGKPSTYPGEHLYDTFKPLISKHMTESGHLTQEQINDINVRPISTEIIDQHISSLKEALLESSENGKELQLEPSQNLFGLFHLSVGHGLDTYRTQVIEKLEALGEEGETIWKSIIQETEKLEQYMYIDTPISYPRTLEAARKKYVSQYQIPSRNSNSV